MADSGELGRIRGHCIGGTGIRNCLKIRSGPRIVPRTPSPCVPLPGGEGIVKPLQLCSLSLWERAGVRAVKCVTASIVARFEPHKEFWDSFILPVYREMTGRMPVPPHVPEICYPIYEMNFLLLCPASKVPIFDLAGMRFSVIARSEAPKQSIPLASRPR